MRFAARFFGVALFSLVLFFFAVNAPAFAQTTPQYNTPQETDTAVPSSLHNYAQTVLLEVMSAAGCQIAGIDMANPKEPCLGFNPQSGKIGYVQPGGLVLAMGGFIGAMYTPPAHLSDFTSDLASNFGIVKPALAQGVGYQSISPLIMIWKVIRNVVYLFFVVIFVIVGFAIMLRFKIDPRTVMSIENQLPKLIVGLLLVTFSFAIAGFLIDVMWLTTFLVINILTPNLPGLDPKLVNGSLFQNPFSFFNNIAAFDSKHPAGITDVSGQAAASIMVLLKGLFTANTSQQLGLTPPTSTGGGGGGCSGWDVISWIPVVGGAASKVACVVSGVVTNGKVGINVGDIIANGVGYLLTFLIGGLGFFVIFIALLIALFRVWFSLLMSYAYILLDIVLGPLFILFGAIPGSKISFTAWVQDLLANLISFPTVIAIFLLGRLFMSYFAPNQQALFVPPLIGNTNATDVAGFSVYNPVGSLIGLALMLITPGIVKTMKELFKAPQNKLGGQIFQNLGGGGKAVMGLGKNIAGGVFGQEIKYTPDGKIVPVQGLEKIWRRAGKNFGIS